MAHIHTDPGQHDHTASAYVLRTDFDEPKIMLHLHKKLGCYLQFGGHVELHETPWQAVAHELREESGYDLDQVQLLQPHVRVNSLTDAVIHPQPVSHSTHPFGKGLDHYHTDIAYAAVASSEPRNQPEDGESINIRLFTRAELTDLPSEEIPENVREIALFIFDKCLEDWHPVPASMFE